MQDALPRKRAPYLTAPPETGPDEDETGKTDSEPRRGFDRRAGVRASQH